MRFQAHARPARRLYAFLAASLSLCALFAAAAVGADPQQPVPPGKAPHPPLVVDPPQQVPPPPVIVDPAIVPEEVMWRPATQPAGALHAQIAKAFAQLADSQPTVRETARQTLMDLARQDLTSLEKVVRQSLPLAPEQLNSLKEIVIHARAAQIGYASTMRDGFLGVRLSEVVINSTEKDKAPAILVPRQEFPLNDDVPPLLNSGVLIVDRMVGFPGERAFHDGDIIIGLVADGQQHVPIRTANDLRNHVVNLTAGRTIEFLVLRQGGFTVVAVTLDPRPDLAVQADVQGIINNRRNNAEDYWKAVFLPMLRDQVQ